MRFFDVETPNFNGLTIFASICSYFWPVNLIQSTTTLIVFMVCKILKNSLMQTYNEIFAAQITIISLLYQFSGSTPCAKVEDSRRRKNDTSE